MPGAGSDYMPRHRPRRARSIRYDLIPSHVETDITLWDHVCLEQLLTSRPDFVLERFREVGIWSLVELEMFRRLWVSDNESALRIVAVARSMGIPMEATPSDEKKGYAA